MSNNRALVTLFISSRFYKHLSHDDVSGSDITPCNKIDKLLVVYRSSNIK